MKEKISKIKSKIDTSNPMTRKLLKNIIIAAIIVFVGIIILIIVKFLFFSRISVTKLEERMEKAAKKYYTEYSELLPEEDKESVTVSIQELVNNNNLKSLDKLLKEKDASCEGNVTVTRNGSEYLYTPYLECTDLYKTKRLYEEIINDKNIVEEKSGLYHINSKYVYRGDDVNNYLKFANQNWRIISVDEEDHSIRVLQEKGTKQSYVWDDRYNSDRKSNIGINEYDTSRIRESLESLWQGDKVFKDKDKKYILNKPLCIGGRNNKDTDKTGTVECQITYKELPLSLMLPSDYLMASLDSQCEKTDDNSCSNYNYLYNDDDDAYYWSTTPYKSDSKNVFYFGPDPDLSSANHSYKLKFVINLSPDSIYLKGDGTKDNPYIIKQFD